MQALEAAVGHRCPPLLRRIHRELADGGWGPEGGVVGVAEDRLTQIYRRWAAEEDVPSTWIPLIKAGDGLYFAVDWAESRGPMRLLDPKSGRPLRDSVVWERPGFWAFLDVWFDGEFERLVYGRRRARSRWSRRR